MIKKTFIFAFRSFKKGAFLNTVNLLGLSLGLTVFFLVSLYLYQEKTYERDFSERDRIHHLSTHLFSINDLAWTSKNLPHVLSEVPSIERFTQFDRRSSKIRADEREFENVPLYLVDSSFLKVFDYKLIAGNPETVLKEPNHVVIMESAAIKMFGNTDVVGKTIYRQDVEAPLIVQGVCKDPQFKTQLKFDLLISGNYSEGIDNESWQSIGSYTYLLAHENTKLDVLNGQIEALSEKYIYPVNVTDRGKSVSFEEWRNSQSYLGYFAEPLMSLRKDSETKNLLMPKLNVAQFNTLLLVGLAALIISVINFVNISTAKASVRLGEVAVKRILGSTRKWLIAQFMAESFMIILLSSMIALALVETVVQLNPEYLASFIGFSVTDSMEWLTGLILFVFLLTIISGIYPALYLSRGGTLSLLRSGTLKTGFSAFNTVLIRKSATVFQLVLTFVLITAVITMFQQLDHLRDRDIGYNSGDIFIIDNTYKLGKSNETFRQALMSQPSVLTAAFADHFPNQAGVVGLAMTTKADNGNEASITPFRVDPTFFDMMEMDFVLGRAFTRGMTDEEAFDETSISQKHPVVINQAAVEAFGLEEPIGAILAENKRVVGVVNDFVFSDLRQSVTPVMLGQRIDRPYFKLAVKMAPGNFDIKKIEEVWSGFSDEKMVWYNFSNNYDRLIKTEDSSFKTILTFSVFAILISCLGLLGLASFTIDQRIKEFGIRKALGASVADITKLFGWGFVKLILLAFVIAVPISVYGLGAWLNDFADRVTLSIGVFLLSALVTFIVVLGTISVQTLRAGRLNPVDTLRNE